MSTPLSSLTSADRSGYVVSVEQPKQTRGKRSPVWDFFNLVEKKDGDGKTIEQMCHCKLCPTIYRYSSSTTQMKDHLQKSHPNRKSAQEPLLVEAKNDGLLIKPEPGQGVLFPTAFGYEVKNPNSPITAETMRVEISLLLLRQQLPFSFVDSDGFRAFLKFVMPEFEALSRKTHQTDIIEIIYPLYRTAIKLILKQEKGSGTKFSFTTDIWTSDHQKKSYMCVTIHFVDRFFKLKHFILAFEEMPYPHSGEKIAQFLIAILQDFDIIDSLVSITLDNASNNKTAMEEMRLMSEALNVNFAFHGAFLHQPCTAHVLNLIAQEALKVLKASIAKVRVLVIVYRKPTNVELFEFYLENEFPALKAKYDQRPTLDVRTRWNSTCLMLRNALIFKDVLNKFSNTSITVEEVVADGDVRNQTLDCQALSATEWEFVKTMEKFLRPLENGTFKVSFRCFPNINKALAVIADLKNRLDVAEQSNDTLIKNSAQIMRTKYLKYFETKPLAFVIANVLDPRFKLDYLRTIMDEATVLECKATIIRMFEEFYRGKPTTTQIIETSKHSNVIVIDDADESSDFTFLRKRTFEEIQSTAKSEVEVYLDEPCIHVSVDALPELRITETQYIKEFDILKWWRDNSGRFPLLATMARNIYGIQASSVASESAFSTSGRVLDEKRASLNAKTLSILMVTESWISAFDRYHHDWPHRPKIIVKPDKP